jgi:hypothetical protein
VGRGSEWFDNRRKLRRLPSKLEAISIRALEEAEGPQTRADRQPAARPLPHLPHLLHVRKVGLPTSFPACPKVGQLHAPLPANDVPSS